MFSIRRVDSRVAEATEQLGTKPKFWFRDGERRFLFKAEVRGTGEDWAEVVSCCLCKLLGLPHVEYELAEEYDEEKTLGPGVICENMAPPPTSLILGNQLLMERDPGYPTQQRFKVRQHTVQAVVEVISKLDPPSREWMSGVPMPVQTALDVFVGYVLLDAWIANQDRHHENWAAIRDDKLRLAPTYDHGAALARNLEDKERQERLATKDANRTVSAFVKRGRSAFYNEGESKPMGLEEAFRKFADSAPAASTAWLERLRAISPGDVMTILSEVPIHRMSGPTKAFTFELLLANQNRLTREQTA